MKSLVLSMATAGLLASFAAPVSAQRYDGELESNRDMQTGTRFARAPETANQSEARQMQRRVARCVFDRNKDVSRNLLAHSDFSSIDFAAINITPNDLFDELKVSECIGRAMKGSTYRMRMRIPFATLRNLLAEEAYHRDNKQALTIASNAPKLLTNRYNYETMGPRAGAISDMADCIVYHAPTSSHDFLDARPGTSDEADAIEAMSPALAECLGEDAPTQVGASMMRQVVADGLWSRAYYGPTSPRALPEIAADAAPDQEAEAE